jgi:hypothetical protein
VSRRRLLLAAATVVLAVAAVVLLVAGVDVRETTGGLLVSPIRQLHLVGGYLLAGTAAGVAAVLTALAAVPARRATAEAGSPDAPGITDRPDDLPPDDVPAHPAEADDADHATTSPGSDRRS